MPGDKNIVVMVSFYLLVVSDTGFAKISFCGMPGMLPTRFSRSDKLCCGGQLHNKTRNGQVVLCCEEPQKTYLQTSQICCGQQIQDVSEVQHLECCDNEFIRKDGDEVCCQNKLYRDYRKTKATRCCNGVPFESNPNLICCGGEIKPIRTDQKCCKGEIYNSTSHVCVGSSVIEKIQPGVCDGKHYDTSTEVCCNERKVVKKPESYSPDETPHCCGDSDVVDGKANQICSRNHVVPGGHLYCTTVAVNVKAGDMCCDGQPFFYKNMPEPAAAQRCCGKRLMNNDNKACCNDVIYDKLNYQCCGGSIISKRDKCCGNGLKGQEYDNRKQMCCEGRRGSSFLVNKTHHNQNSCCNRKLYDKFKYRCTNDEIVPISGMCKENDKDLCCQGNLFKGAKERGQIHCCRDKPYDASSQGCCAGVVYQLNTHGCYGGRVVDKDRPSKRQVATHQPASARPTHKPTHKPTLAPPSRKPKREQKNVVCSNAVTWTKLNWDDISCDDFAFIVKYKKKRGNRTMWRRRAVLIGNTKAVKKIWRLKKCKTIRSKSMILIVSDMKSRFIKNVIFVKNTKANRKLLKTKCKQSGKS